MIHNSSAKGFTLIELIVYFTIFGFIASLGVTLLSFSVKGRAIIRENGDVQMSAQRALEQMIDRVRNATTVTDASTTLNLKMASSTLDPTIFRLNAGAVTIQEGAGTQTALTPGTVIVSSLTFTKITNAAPSTSSVIISITAGYNDSGAVKAGTSYTLQTAALPLR
jgi:type II secretory pathway pseudopilin PulG